MTSPIPEASPGTPPLRWRRIFPGEERQIRQLRQWLCGLLPGCATRDDVVAVAVELGTNAIRHTVSGRGGWFAAEISWHRTCVRVAVADQGGSTGPRLIDQPTAEKGRGLVLVRGFSARMGVSGDHRGRLVWADVPGTGEDTEAPAALTPGYEAAIRDGQATLNRRHQGIVTWFGHATQQWWALTRRPGDRGLVAADSRNSSRCCLMNWLPSNGPGTGGSRLSPS